MPHKIKETLYKWCIDNNSNIFEEYSDDNTTDTFNVSAKESKVKRLWYCKKHYYHWSETVYNRIRYPIAPCCSGKAVMNDNNFAVMFPELLKDWDYSKNELNQYKIKSQIHDIIFWKCHKCGNEWNTKLCSRTIDFNRFGYCNCPKCSSKHTSLAEQIIYRYCKNNYQNTQNRYTKTGVELDVHIPELKLAIEYDGVAWHKDKLNIHVKKLNNALKNGIFLVNIMEYKEDYDKPLDNYTENHNVIELPVDSTYNIEEKLISIVRKILYYRSNIEPKPVEKNFIQNIKNSMTEYYVDKSLNDCIPWIKNWYSKLNKKSIDKISYGSSETIKLQCPNCGYEREIKVHWILKQFTGCKKCKCRDNIPIEHIERIKNKNAEYYQKRKEKLKKQRESSKDTNLFQ